MPGHGMQAEKAAADEQMSFVFSKKKAVVAEKRQKKEQKEEAEKHIRMQKELVRPARHIAIQTCIPERTLFAAGLTPHGSVHWAINLSWHCEAHTGLASYSPLMQTYIVHAWLSYLS